MDVFLGVFFIIICLLLIVVVLLQKGRGGGLGAAFGGAGAAAFGTRVGDVFTWVTIVLTGLFLLLAIGTSLIFRTPPGVVLAPVFDPPPGPIEETIQVRLGAETLGAKIRFTRDGSDPTDESAVYEGKALPVEPGDVIKARAFRENWQPSDVAIGRYPKKVAETLPAAPLDTRPAGEPDLPAVVPQ